MGMSTAYCSRKHADSVHNWVENLYRSVLLQEITAVLQRGGGLLLRFLRCDTKQIICCKPLCSYASFSCSCNLLSVMVCTQSDTSTHWQAHPTPSFVTHGTHMMRPISQRFKISSRVNKLCDNNPHVNFIKNSQVLYGYWYCNSPP